MLYFRFMFKSCTLLLVLFGFSQCRNINPVNSNSTNKDERNFSRVISLSNLKATEFVPTLESTCSKDKNIIYSPTFLFAWNEIRQSLQQPIKINSSDIYLSLINTSGSYKNSLNAGEYDKEISIDDNVLNIRAYFKQSLPFDGDLDTLNKPFKFKGTNVNAFGMPDYYEPLAKKIDILYYKNDEEFIIKLIPKNSHHEIILAKGFNNITRLDSVLINISAKIKIGDTERRDTAIWWRYELNSDDRVIIPILNFNLETHYSQVEGDTIHVSSKQYEIRTAYQRIAFILDQHGAKVESEADVAVAAAAAPPDNRIHPKLLLFNSPFIVLLRKLEKPPYFMMKVENAELMKLWTGKIVEVKLIDPPSIDPSSPPSPMPKK